MGLVSDVSEDVGAEQAQKVARELGAIASKQIEKLKSEDGTRKLSVAEVITLLERIKTRSEEIIESAWACDD